MRKKTKDIKVSKENKPIDLGGARPKKSPKQTQKAHTFFKKEQAIKKVQDLHGSAGPKYIYIKGRKFQTPAVIGNLIRLGIGGFLIILLINTANVYGKGKKLQEQVSQSAFEGFSQLVDGGRDAGQIQFEKAIEAFDNAYENFEDAENELWFIGSNMTIFAQEGNSAHAANSLIEGGKLFASAGKHFLSALEEFNKIPIYFVAKNENPEEENFSLTDTLKTGLEKTDLAIEDISLAREKIESVNIDSLPSELQSRVEIAKGKIQQISETLELTSEHFPALLKLLGDRYPHRYLVLLQNNHEIRPSGGFIGSYAIVDINEGFIEKIEVFDSYDIDGSYGPHIEPPGEFKAFTQNWRFRDSNYSHDFPLTAQKARWFLEKQGGPSVDTVIAINQGLLKPLLEITGPIKVGDFGPLNSQNYNLLLSFIIEGKVWGPEDPKHILKKFIPVFTGAILKEQYLTALSSNLYKALQQKHIMLYSADSDVQALFEAVKIDGSSHQLAEKEDYLAVINISAGGTKSDPYIEEKIKHHTHIDKKGRLTNELTISRSHMWDDKLYYNWRNILQQYGFKEIPNQIIDILGRGRNKSVMKIYLPPDIEVIESSTTESDYEEKIELKYDEELEKSYLLTTVEVRPGESETVTIKYQLPYSLKFKPADSYKLIVEKQPGSIGSIFTKTLSTDLEITTLALNPSSEIEVSSQGEATYATNLVYDRYFSGIFQD